MYSIQFPSEFEQGFFFLEHDKLFLKCRWKNNLTQNSQDTPEENQGEGTCSFRCLDSL